MLNIYYWYSIITGGILFLYLIPVSEYNAPLNGALLVLMILSILVALFLGKKYNEKFEYRDCEYKKNKYEFLPLFIIVALSVLEFVIAGDIPLISVTINHARHYKEFATIPFLHVFTNMIAMYYAILYMYKAISYKNDRKKHLISFVVINIIFLLFNTRSFFMYSLFISINLLVAKYRKRKTISNITIKEKIIATAVTISCILIVLFGFGCFGNMRQGGKWYNSDYIETVGMYNNNWPKLIPKQYMWTYSYITSPLANFNYNVQIDNTSFSVMGIIYQFIPVTFSKRIIETDKIVQPQLYKPYFTVSTGFCSSYVNGGYIGLIMLWSIIMIAPLFLFKYKNIKNKKYMMFIFIYNICIVFMSFDNMFTDGGTSPVLWLCILLLLLKNKNKKEIENEQQIIN